MTQEVQPLTWQKRTNLEEHQQFFAKINEIIANLAPTVGEAEAAIAQATAAIASANDAVATANTASAAASAAASQAQTAASAVAGYDDRLTAVEVQAATNKSDISRLNTQSVKLSADHIQTITGGLDLRGTNTSPNTDIGEDDNVIANGHRIIQELNAYPPMVRTTGNQLITGFKMLGISPARVGGYNVSDQKVIGVNSGSVGYAMSTAYLSGEPTTDYKYYDLLRLQDANNKSLFNLRFSIGPNLQRLEAVISKKNGTSQTIVLATVDD